MREEFPVHSQIERARASPLRRTLLLAAAVAVIPTSAYAVNRCTDGKGRVTFQDAACEATANARGVDTSDSLSTKLKSQNLAPPPLPAPANATGLRATPSNASASEYANARGAWRGPLQFQFVLGGVRDGSAQLVTPAVVEIRETGEVIGVIPASGCKLSGLASQFASAASVSLDISLKDCRDPRFNVRFGGHLISNQAAKEAKLTLNAISMPIFSGKPQHASLAAVLKR